MNYGFNYDVNEHTGEMIIYNNDNEVISTISECNGRTKEELNTLADDVLYDLGYITKNYFTEEE